jgi:PAS domain S-box-containing protein
MKTNLSVRSLLLIFAILFTTLPVALFGVLEVREEVQAARSAGAEMSRRSALLIAGDIEREVDKYRALFEGAALDIDRRTLHAKDPDGLHALLQQYPEITAAVVLNDKAVSVVSYSTNVNVRVGVDYSDRSQVQQARATRKTALSGNQRGRVLNSTNVIFEVPLLAADGNVAGFLGGAVPPAEFGRHLDIAPSEFALVTDALGHTVLASSGQTGFTTPELENISKALSGAPDGVQKTTIRGRSADVDVLGISSLGWKITVGLSPDFADMRVAEGVRRAAVLAVLCALIGAAIVSLFSLSAAKGIKDVGEQLEHMSAVALRPIQISANTFFPHELKALVENFNNLLDRTAKATLAELEAISRVYDSILIANPGGLITYVNEAGIKTFGEVVGQNLRDLMDGKSAEAVFANGQLEEWKGEITVRRGDGSTFDGFLSSTPILDNNRVTSVVAIIQDFTDEKAARESRIQSEKMITLGELVAGTSHELNNPLAIVTGYSDLLLEDESLGSEQRSKIESIRKNALRASSVVHSLLAFARKRKPERQHTDLNRVVNAAADLKDYDLLTSGIQFGKDLQEVLPPVFADPNQLQQVLLNVINNAQDAVLNVASPSIHLHTEADEKWVRITVEDNGAGISKADLKKVFDPFFTTKPVGKGTGLGLSISYGIVHEHNGSIRVRSEVGQGTQVCIELPIDANAKPQTEGAASAASSGNGARIHVLVVDDEPEIVALLRMGLGRLGIGVDSATSMLDAMTLATHRTYDFVLTDVKMPGGSGIDFYKQLCLVAPAYSRRTIFLTGDTSNSATVEFLEREGLAYFSKPFDFQAIERHLSEVHGA